MAIDWQNFQSEIDQLIGAAGNRTDKKLAGKLSTISRLTDEEVERLFPDPGDVKRLADLMEIVKGADKRNAKINAMVSKAEEFAGIVLTLLEKFA